MEDRKIRCRITIHAGSQTFVLTDDDLRRYTAQIGLEQIVPGRYTWTLAVDILLKERVYGIEPWTIVEEVKGLEEGRSWTNTKPAAQFEREPLRGYWHKHYFCARFVAENIRIALGQGRLERIAAETIAKALADGNEEALPTLLGRRLTREPIERRDEDGLLTGEWIVFAKHGQQNFYLCLAEHSSGDAAIHELIQRTCLPQFPFLTSG